jgi:glycosyltransferase involved in cell wall biosynthesis
MPPTYSLVVPIFNEEAVIPILLRRLDALLETLDARGEVILVDDGSRDTSAIVIEAKARVDKRYRLIKLSRNFGHQIAITVGLDHAAGRAVIVMDADLQDPPEVVLDMIAKWKEGYDVVSAERTSRQGESRFKRATANLFYRLMDRLGDASMPRNVGDFRLVDRRALDCFLAMPERDRFVRGMFAWIGFRQGTVAFDRPPRAAGDSKYSVRKMIALAANGLVSFSDAPLRLALWAGGAVSALAFVYGLSVIGRWALSDPTLERGWSSTIVVIAALGGANMLMTGVIGLYVGRIYAEAKGRPLYVVDRAVGFDAAPAAARAPTRASESGSPRPGRGQAQWS